MFSIVAKVMIIRRINEIWDKKVSQAQGSKLAKLVINCLYKQRDYS